MLVNTQGIYERSNSSQMLDNNMRLQTSRTSIKAVHIGSICLVIRTQNKAVVSIQGVDILYEQILGGHRKLLLNVPCSGNEVILFIKPLPIEPYVCAVYCELWCQIICFICVSRYVGIFHVGVFLCIRDTCIGLCIYVSI